MGEKSEGPPLCLCVFEVVCELATDKVARVEL